MPKKKRPVLFVGGGTLPGGTKIPVYCPDCIPDDLDLSNGVELWEVGSEGWVHCPICSVCLTSIRVVVNGGRQRGKLPIQVTLVRYDETRYWSLANLPHGDKVAAIHTVYIFDRNEVTHCCEMTPSYCLHWLRVDVEFKSEVSDKVREKVEEAVNEEALRGLEPVHYQWCSLVERFVKNSPKHVYVDTAAYETFDAAFENHQGNWHL